MRTIRKILTALLIAISAGFLFGGASTTAIAAETAAGVNAAIDALKKMIPEAIQIAAEGTDQEGLVKKINEIKQIAKEITGDAIGAKLQNFQSAVRMARGKAKRGDLAGAEESLKEALKILNTFPRA
ncbi:MAG: hypothetical protein AXA67_06825 [Methylothermaceae bacteria B42]|nr:MAG: hypothetical protein AXA67_06825 [Methylothermaceae bacteria B42]HHJ40262.1 hypothetical protein [Methylothermaceae bacterium]